MTFARWFAEEISAPECLPLTREAQTLAPPVDPHPENPINSQ